MSSLKFLCKQQKIYRLEILKARRSSPVAIYATTPLINQNRLQQYGSDYVYIRDGIVVVASGARTPDGFTI